MVDFAYRKMRESDYESAIALWQSLPGMGLSGADSKVEISKFLNMNPDSCWAAELNGELIGTILGGNDGRRGYIYHLAIKSACQSKGVGKALLQRCLIAFRHAGIQKCHLMVYPDNTNGIGFWKHAGWVVREDVLTMSKVIG